MKWIAATVTFTSPDREQATDLVADIFYALDLKGVVIDDPERDSEADWGEDALPPPEMPGVTGYFADTSDAAERCRELELQLARLETRTGIAARVTYRRIDEADWAEAWKAFFWPERITDRIIVKPTWRDYPARPGEIILEIDPGMAFGTGTHATTALCIQLIEAHLANGHAFLDVGTGSGILMIAAAKLGAGEVCGVDNDPVAVTVAEKNLLVNGIACFRLVAGNLVEAIDRSFDVVAANILAEVILVLLHDVVSVVKPGGLFICSGIITAKKDAVLSGLQDNGFAVVEILEKEGWVAIAARRTEG
jgi:ribosomal protein L11 methyltransferase